MLHVPTFALASALALSLAACSSGEASPSPGAGAGGGASTTATTTSSTTTGGAGGGGFDPGGEVTTYSKVVGPLTIEPGGEDTQCVTLRTGNAAAGLVRRFRGKLSDGSHHMIVYLANDTVEKPDPKHCGGFSGLLTGDYPIFIAQQADAELAFPDDIASGLPVGFAIAQDQMLRFELHFVNTTAAPLDVSGTIEMDTVPVDTPAVHSSFAFWGSANISIPPASGADTGVVYQAGIPGTSTFGLTTHQHQLGTRMRVWYADAQGPIGDPVADATDWANPPLVQLDPPLTYPDDGSKGLAWQCEWQNTTPDWVGFGESFYDEMCFLWHYYYPSHGFQLCTEQGCSITPD